MAQEGVEPSASLVLSESGLPVAYRAGRGLNQGATTQGGIRTHRRPGLSRAARPVGVAGHGAVPGVGIEPTAPCFRDRRGIPAPHNPGIGAVVVLGRVGMPGVEPGITCAPCTHVDRYTTPRVLQSTQQDLNPRFGTWQGRMLPSYIMGAWRTNRVVKEQNAQQIRRDLNPDRPGWSRVCCR